MPAWSCSRTRSSRAKDVAIALKKLTFFQSCTKLSVPGRRLAHRLHMNVCRHTTCPKPREKDLGHVHRNTSRLAPSLHDCDRGERRRCPGLDASDDRAAAPGCLVHHGTDPMTHWSGACPAPTGTSLRRRTPIVTTTRKCCVVSTTKISRQDQTLAVSRPGGDRHRADRRRPGSGCTRVPTARGGAGCNVRTVLRRHDAG